MTRMSPGWVTDLAILELTGSSVTDHGDHLVIRTPDNPGYHWGNCLLVTDPDTVDDADRWAARFGEEFPDATWFAAGLPILPGDARAWARHDLELEQLDVLTTTSMPATPPRPPGYTVRMLSGDDWQLVADRDITANLRTEEFDPDLHADFVRARVAERRQLCERGLAAFVGAFSEEELVADLGIVRCGTLGRFQDVGTDDAHRRLGLASHLLGVAAEWAHDRGCNGWVIVTESTNDAGRVYRRAGFTLDDAVVTAYRRHSVAG